MSAESGYESAAEVAGAPARAEVAAMALARDGPIHAVRVKP